MDSIGLPPRQQFLMHINQIWFLSALRAAAHYNFASLIGDSFVDTTELSVKTSTKEDLVFRLLRFLATHGYFEASETEPRTFRNTPLSHCLRDDVPSPQRAMPLSLLSRRAMEVWLCLENFLETGVNAPTQLWGESLYAYFDRPERREERALFDASLRDYAQFVDIAISKAYRFRGRVVDIGGGSGTLLDAIVAHYPDAHGVLFERPAMIEVLRQQNTLFDLVPGDYFVEVPGGDSLILKQVLHNWQNPECIRILQTCRHALSENGTLIIAEHVVDPENGAGPFAKGLDLLMGLEQDGRERTQEEFVALLQAADLTLVEVLQTPSPLVLFVAKALKA